MYVSRFRGREFERFTTRYADGSIRTDVEIPLVVETVYSWRTGHSLKRDLAEFSSGPSTNSELYGIRRPSSKGNLVDKLADRKRYTEELMRSAFPADDGGVHAPNRYSKTDSGHLFGTVKCVQSPIRIFSDTKLSSASFYKVESERGDSFAWQDYTPYSYPIAIVKGSPLMTQTERQGMFNRYFASTAPDRQDASLMVALIELLRGDIPSVVRNIEKLALNVKTLRNYAGSEYLNATFGWAPLLADARGVIMTMLTLDKAVYFDSFRRTRAWEGPSNYTSGRLATSASNTALNGSVWFPDRRVLNATGSLNSNITVDWSRTVAEDYFFSSRYTGLARPNSRTNGFADRAQEILKRIGVGDDPRIIWDLMPYSWLLDWVTTMGNSISNANTYSPLKGKYSIDYAYVTTQVSDSVSRKLVSIDNPPSRSVHTVQRDTGWFSSVSRWRDRATPFGFGTQLGGLTPSQFAILVALGFAQSR